MEDPSGPGLHSGDPDVLHCSCHHTLTLVKPHCGTDSLAATQAQKLCQHHLIFFNILSVHNLLVTGGSFVEKKAGTQANLGQKIKLDSSYRVLLNFF